ncbi:TPA: helix-turn-helix transcriptional regulator [Burkholderia multivorans]|uniref:helix-turn-helix domain-containing protein n=1 Tax=Burkholderia multivorans TaxID=87883 RepID=UPI0021C17B0D|nr:AraC family transcriptional regulator [Burkholderia multivorans]MDN8027937.1 AraC family transcriptional regulator [Burkholderia multivorans]HEF4742827.1 helix-turn-helix transcriptional regulator [Burkholderia multivorans]
MEAPFFERTPSERVRVAATWIAANIERHITIAQAATVAAMSERSFARHFSRTFGMPPVDYIARTRLMRARYLLASTELSIKSVARHSGFGSGEHLARTFRRMLGQSPTEYRRRATTEKVAETC